MNTDTPVQELLTNITDLSHEFGTTDYVRGGGGNTSAKNDSTLWVKPSGTTLQGLTPETFVAMDRGRLAELYALETPSEANAREALVKDEMAAAVLPDSSGRASVEAPLHESLAPRYVVHTHPALVNGMTCARNGRAVAQRLFPEALWLDFIDPGYTLCMRVREEILAYRQSKGNDPALIFLKNHGVFVSADSPEEIRRFYSLLFERLNAEYEQAGITTSLTVDPVEVTASVAEQIHIAFNDDSLAIKASQAFAVPAGPISPDHIVYAKSFPLLGEPTLEAVAAYKGQYGYYPRIIVWDDKVYAVEANDKKAALALEMAQDGALVEQMAAAFGGIEYMTEEARAFIENWEVESYRSKQI